jgi:NADH-ubiquinone oxidoreductase chain 2
LFIVIYIQSIGSGIGIFSGLFHAPLISQSLETFFYLVGAIISFFDTFLTMDILSGETMLLLSSLVRPRHATLLHTLGS